MTRMKLLLGALMLSVALGAAPNAHAACAAGTGGAGVACLHYLAAGSSAMFQGFGVTVVNEIAPSIKPAGGSVHHYTFKSQNPPGELAALLRDSRSGLQGTTIPDEPATVWVTYVCTSAPGGQCTAGTATDVWAYLQVDSTVGVRSIMSRDANPGADCHGAAGCAAVRAELDANTKTSVAGANVITPTLLTNGAPSWGAGDTSCPGAATTCDDQFLVPEVYAALNNYPIIVGATDIRFEDAKYATKRSTAPPSNGSGLGYGVVGSQLVGTSIQSQFSHTTATPVEFGLPGGGDPISAQAVPSTLVAFPVGESPILVITNRTSGTGLGALVGGLPAFADVEDDNGAKVNRLSNLFSGNTCAGSNTTFEDSAGVQSLTAAGIGDFPVHIIQREPLSGTYNTFEFTEIRTADATDGNNALGTWNNASACTSGSGAQGGTQECGVNGATNNPLNLTCFSGGGTRQRAVGTGELVSQVKAGSTFGKDAIGYTFFSYANVSSIGGAVNSGKYGYLTIDHVDGLFNAYAGGDPGQPATGGSLPGTLPTCTPGTNCDANHVWTAGNSFPHLRDGTYRSWSLLRQICDTTDNNCTADPVGASNIITTATNDIHTSAATSVADYLALQDIRFIRAHFTFKQFSGTSHGTPFVHFADLPFTSILDRPTTAGELAGKGANGGDAGGCQLAVNSHNDTVVNITAATFNGVTMNTKYTYTVASGGPLSVGDLISITGFGNGDDTPITGSPLTFSITAVSPTVFTVHNPSGVTVGAATALGSTGQTNCMQ